MSFGRLALLEETIRALEDEFLRSAELAIAPILEQSEELALQSERQRRDLVEKERAGFRLLDEPKMGASGSC